MQTGIQGLCGVAKGEYSGLNTLRSSKGDDNEKNKFLFHVMLNLFQHLTLWSNSVRSLDQVRDDNFVLLVTNCEKVIFPKMSNIATPPAEPREYLIAFIPFFSDLFAGQFAEGIGGDPLGGF